MIPTDRYCHSGPGNGDNSILTKLSVMPFCRGTAVYSTGSMKRETGHGILSRIKEEQWPLLALLISTSDMCYSNF